MKKVFFTHKIPNIAEEKLKKAGFEVIVYDIKDKEDIIFNLEKYKPEILICLLTDKIDEQVIKSNPNLEVIATYSVGYNHIDIDFAKKRGIKIIHTPGVLTKTVAEHTIGLILAAAQRIVEADKFTREGKFKGWEPELFLGHDLYSKKLGIVGAGRIGTEVAKIAKNGFSMDILYFDVKQNPYIEQSVSAEYFGSVDELLSEADIVSLHVPLLDSTKGMINKERMLKMKKDAILVNTSRGPVIVENDLIEVLSMGHLFSVALDVFENEPKISDELKSMKNVILTPHIASASLKTRNKMAQMVADGIISIYKGEIPDNELL